ncbi:MAG: OmpA family protein [Bacteroidota bacterium]
MSARALSMLVLLTTLGWFWFSQKWHCCWIRGACCEKPVVEKLATGPATLQFNWSTPKPTTTEQFADYKAEILKGNSGDNLLEIVGKYYANESNATDFDNLGLARANAIKALLVDEIPEERIRLKAIQVSGSSADSNQVIPNTDFRWTEIEVKQSEVVVMADRTIILFPYNSAQKEADPKVDEYLDKLVARLKGSGEKVSLTGHTDSDGDEQSNEQLAKRRADYIASLLKNKGVDIKQLETHSKGESSPVASNDTEAGKHQNRRVELRILQ